MRTCVLNGSQSSPIAQLKSMAGLSKVRRFKDIQLQRVTGSEDQMIEITDLLKEVLSVTLIREIERVPFRFSVERCDRLFNPLRITRHDDCLSASRHRLLRDRQTDTGRPSEHYNSFLVKLGVILYLL